MHCAVMSSSVINGLEDCLTALDFIKGTCGDSGGVTGYGTRDCIYSNIFLARRVA